MFDDPDVLTLSLLPPVYDKLDATDCLYGDLDVLMSIFYGFTAGFVNPKSDVLLPPNLILA